MSLPNGSRLGPYEILAPLGAGGMGEVYRARDPRLGREVAIKVLPAERLSDAARRRRFVQEARAASSLNHPNIVTIHEVEKDGDTDFIVMELVPGKSLDQLIPRSGMPLSEALRLAIPIADALSRAHAAGIVHRDLKPANVVVNEEGIPKVLDFGLAKLLAREDVADQAVLTAETAAGPLSQPGSISGTPGYMSPEQATGGKVDARSDIFSFGCVLYEMVTGRRAFAGASRQEALSAVVASDPRPLSELVPGVPAELERLILRCLHKSPDRRVQSIADVRLTLQDVAEDLRSSPSPGAPSRPEARSHSSRRKTMVLASVGAGMATLLALAAWSLWQGGPGRAVSSPPAVRMALTTPRGTAAADPGRMMGPPVVSPDGSAVVLTLHSAGDLNLYIRRFDSDRLELVEGTRGATYPFWSPDSRRIGFFADAKLKTIPAGGGGPVVLCDAVESRGGAWGKGGVIVFGINQKGIFRVPESGGEPVELTTLDTGLGENSHRYPVFLPDGERFLYFSRTKDLEKRGIYLDSLDRTMPRKRIMVANGQFALGRDPAAREHYLITQQVGGVVGQRFDASRGELLGEPRRVTDVAGQLSASDTGTLVIRRENESDDLLRIVWFDREGREAAILAPPADYWQLELAPDAKRVAITKHDYLSGYFAVWLASPSQGLLSPFSDEKQRSVNPLWSPDGLFLHYLEFQRRRMYRGSVEAPGKTEPLYDSIDEDVRPRDISGDGRYILGERRQANPPASRVVFSVFGSNQWHALAGAAAVEQRPRFSPDGRFVAYDSNQSGVTEVYVVAFPDGGQAQRVSVDGGREPHWRGDGRELFYLSTQGAVMAVPLPRPGEFTDLKPTRLFQIVLHQQSEGPLFAVTRDGQRFLAITGREGQASGFVDVILNWPSLLPAQDH